LEEERINRLIEYLKELLGLDNIFLEALKEGDLSKLNSFMEKRIHLIRHIKYLMSYFCEQKNEKSRYVKQLLRDIKEKEENIIFLASKKKDEIKMELKVIEDALKVRARYRKIKNKNSIFERIG